MATPPRNHSLRTIHPIRRIMIIHVKDSETQIAYLSSDEYFEQTGLIHESIENLLLEVKNLLTQYSTIQNELGI